MNNPTASIVAGIYGRQTPTVYGFYTVLGPPQRYEPPPPQFGLTEILRCGSSPSTGAMPEPPCR